MKTHRALGLTLLFLAPAQWIMAQNEAKPRLVHRAPSEEQMAAARKSYQQQEAEWEASMRIEIRAIGVVGGEPIAFVYVNQEPGFVAKNVAIASWEVESVDLATQTVTLKNRSKQQRILPLTNPQAVAFPQLSYEEYFRLREQEGWGRAENIPFAAHINWPSFDTKAKEQILLEALARGEVVGPRTGVHASSGSGTTLFQKEIMRHRAARREKFEASLTARQKSDWLKYRAEPAISLRASPEEREAQLSIAKENKERAPAGYRKPNTGAAHTLRRLSQLRHAAGLGAAE